MIYLKERNIARGERIKTVRKLFLTILLSGVIGTAGGGVSMSGAENETKEVAELNVLVAAKTFDDDVAGERPGNGQSPTYLAYQKLVSRESPVAISYLKELQDKATPAGQLYIAALIREYDSRAGNLALRKLFNSTSKVNYMSGCMSQEYSVAEIAKQLLETSRFQNFRLRARGKAQVQTKQ